MELTLSQEFELAKVASFAKDCSKEQLETIVVELTKQNYMLRNFWKNEGKA